jgi:hypothetical protein
MSRTYRRSTERHEYGWVLRELRSSPHQGPFCALATTPPVTSFAGRSL